jgi:hypothetical protein
LIKHYLNTTKDYHEHKLDSLAWEITLSVMLEDPRSLCRTVLRKGDTFGNLLFDYLSTVVPMGRIRRLIEVGGGYGYLMRDFLSRNKELSATLIDISPFLLAQQREALRGFPVQFLQEDFFEMHESVLSNIDLAILNEVVGDFPTACEVPRDMLLEPSDTEDPLLREVRRIHKRYELTPPFMERFKVNLGAIHALEKLCSAQIPYIYISEHSCEARVPKQLVGLLELTATGDPERIRLHGHDEYSIRFSDLERVASSYGYSALRGQYIDFIEPEIKEDVEFILRLGSSKIDRHEIIRQFMEDLIKYEYLVLSLSA